MRKLLILLLFSIPAWGQITAYNVPSSGIGLTVCIGPGSNTLSGPVVKYAGSCLGPFALNATTFGYLDLSTGNLLTNTTGAPSGACPIFEADTNQFQVTAVRDKRVSICGGGAGLAGGNSQSASSAYTFFLSTTSSCNNASSVGTTICALNNLTSKIDFSGTDTAVVFNSVTSALAGAGGTLFFKSGVYPINSMTLETATGCSNFQSSGNALAYGLAFPSNTNLGTSVQWIIEGEGNTVWPGESGATTVNTNGVIFNVTSTAVSSVAANSVLAAFWQRPLTNCTLVAGNTSNDAYFSNLAVRFPTNQRGNEIAIASYFLSDVGYSNVLADFALSYNSIATGSAPVVGSYNSIGLTSTVSSAANIQRFDRTYVAGYNIGYDWQSEHITSNTSGAIYCNFPAYFGRSSSPVIHPMVIEHFTDQENLHGIQFGSNMQTGTRVDIFGLDMELGQTNWYARGTANLTETNPGATSGIITYTLVQQGFGVSQSTGLFAAGGQNFTQINSDTIAAPIFPPGFDTFTRVNSNTQTGSGWQNINGANPCGTISSNSFTSASGAALCAWTINGNLTDQFSKATINTLDANGVTVGVRSSVLAVTYYDYVCLGTAGGRAIRSRIAGTFTTLASTASNCTTSNTLELIAVGSSLFGYYAGNLDLTAVDTNITSGYPAVIVGGTGDSFTNWTGGAVPIRDNNRSLFNSPIYSTHFLTTTNCQLGGASGTASPAACGSATAGSIAVPASQTSYQVNTTQVNAGSHIFVQQITDNSGISTATCNSGATTPIQSTRSVGTSFTITLTSVASVTCFQYWIID